VSVDAENDLIYFNTYSPTLDKTTSDRHWHHEITEGQVPGLYGNDSENFVIELDLGGTTTRTLSTNALTVAAGAPTKIGPTQTTEGDEPVNVVLDGVVPGIRYGWFVDLEDAAGHVTRSRLSTFVITAASTPSAPTDVVIEAAGDTVTVEWSAPSDDGGADLEQYEIV